MDILQMCRYLACCGADCRKTIIANGWFPMYWAAAGGHLEIVRFLSQDGGAYEDTPKLTSDEEEDEDDDEYDGGEHSDPPPEPT